MKTRIGVLASGGGSNMQAIMRGIDAGEINGEIVVVISDVPGAGALAKAEKADIPTRVMRPREYPGRDAYSAALAAEMKSHHVDLVVMAGFMRIVTAPLINAFPNHIMNIHPALIPAFCGAGFYGHYVHEAVLDYGARVSGCTVHFVEEAVDAGPIIIQRSVPVLDDDTPEALAARILKEEHIAYPEAVRLYCAGFLGIEGRRVVVKG
jgi:phosphoribosylglycinamide formyltransferase-1